MKILITSFFILFGFQVCSQSNLVVGLTDYNIMFRAYDNKLQCQIDGVDSVYIKSPEGKSDVSFEIEALNKLPGPFIKYFIQSIGSERTARLVGKSNSKTKVVAIIGLAYVTALVELVNPVLGVHK